MPAISVVLPVYNAEAYLNESIKSILNQTFDDFELIVLDDCSTDSSLSILQNFNDQRIRLVSNNSNLKVVKTLNKGLALANGEFIARMDADDISHPTRFEKQVAFLKKHPNIDLCGSWVQTFGAESLVMRTATEHEHIKVRLFFVNPMFHPAVMFRADSFRRYNLSYGEQYKNAEDYGLWVKAIDHIKFANLPEILLKYRIHASNVSVLKESNKKILDDIHFNIYRHFLDKLHIGFTDNDLLMQRKLGMVQVGPLSSDELNLYLQWLKKLVIANLAVNYFDKAYLKDVVISYLLYLSKLCKPVSQSMQLIQSVFGGIYNFTDYTTFLVNRTRVKLRRVKQF